MMTFGTQDDGTLACAPDVTQADDEVLVYWIDRAEAANHCVLVARYSDLVWDMAKVISTEDRRRERFECAKQAIDSYIAASRLDEGEVWSETRQGLIRALELGMSIKDKARIDLAVQALIDYVKRTETEGKIGTFVYVFDCLLPPKKGPQVSAQQEKEVVELLEARFASMTTSDDGSNIDPFGPRDVGLRLVSYYERKQDTESRTNVLRAIAEAFERRAKLKTPLESLILLQEARNLFIQAGLRTEAERIQLESQRVGPEAEAHLTQMSVSHEIATEEVDRYVEAMVEGGLEKALPRIAVHFIPSQNEIKEQANKIAEEYPLQEILSGQSAKLGHGHIEANVGDETGDPDGQMAHATAQHLQLAAPWLRWVLDRLTSDGMTALQLLTFLQQCPLFEATRLPIVRRGLEAHFLGDYVQAIHVLIPQIEHALVLLPPLAGRPSNKAHQSGRGVMQFKNLNDLLARDEWPIRNEMGENVRMYLVSALAHPKGLNMRHEVCHGLWCASDFSRQASDLIVHVLLTISLIGRKTKDTDTESAAIPPEGPSQA